MTPSVDETRARLAQLLRAADGDIPQEPIDGGRPIRIALRAIRIRAFLLVAGAVALAVVLTTTTAIARNRIRPNGGSASPTTTSTAPSTGTPTSTAPPSVPVVTITSGPVDPINQTTATFAFTVTPSDAPTECHLDGGRASQCSTGVRFDDLGEGPHLFEARGIGPEDTAGGWAGYRWTIDLTPPTVTFTSVTLDYGSGSKADCSVDGQRRADCAGTITDLSGAHTFEAQVFGGTNSTSLTWDLVATPPQVSFQAGPSPPGGAAIIVASAVSEQASCTVDGASVPCDRAITKQEDTSQDTDVHEEIDVIATDRAGNMSETMFGWGYSLATIVG